MAKETFEIFQRDSNRLTLSEFYESYMMEKYNFDPPYQRDYNIWAQEKQSFLIDTIFKNYPMPPIFLETKIVKRHSKYDVIDGKQRLTSIIKFINDEIALPSDFDSDAYGNKLLNGKCMSELEGLANQGNEIIKKYLDNFWHYKISVEYIENPSYKVVDSIFDRLNREGERLSPSELRKASYYDTLLYKLVDEFSNLKFWSKLLDHQQSINKKRLDHYSFISELLFLLLEDRIIKSYESEIDELYVKWTEELSKDKIKVVRDKFLYLTDFIESLNIDFDKYKVRGISHLYALWSFIYFIDQEYNLNECRNSLSLGLDQMYDNYSRKTEDDSLTLYRQTMQSGSKNLSQRRRRIASIASYLGYELDRDI